MFSVPIKGRSPCYASLHCEEYWHNRTWNIHNAGKTMKSQVKIIIKDGRTQTSTTATSKKLCHTKENFVNFGQTQPFGRIKRRGYIWSLSFFPSYNFFIVDLLKDNLMYNSRSKILLPPISSVDCIEVFCNRIIYYITIRDTLNISKSAVGRTVRHVSNLLCQLANEFMQIPRGEELIDCR